MALPTRAVTCKLYDQQGNPAAKARIRFTLTVPELIDGVVAPEMLEKTADENGVAVFDLVPNVLGVNGSQYQVRAWNPDTGKKFIDGVCTVPDIACFLHDILVSDPPPTIDSAQQALSAAQAYAVAAGNSAGEAENSADQAQATVPVWAAVAPSSPIPGAQWVSSITGRRFTWVVDANSSQWVEMGTVVAIGYASQEAAAVAVAASEAAEASEDVAMAQAAIATNAAAAAAAAPGASAAAAQAVIDSGTTAINTSLAGAVSAKMAAEAARDAAPGLAATAAQGVIDAGQGAIDASVASAAAQASAAATSASNAVATLAGVPDIATDAAEAVVAAAQASMDAKVASASASAAEAEATLAGAIKTTDFVLLKTVATRISDATLLDTRLAPFEIEMSAVVNRVSGHVAVKGANSKLMEVGIYDASMNKLVGSEVREIPEVGEFSCAIPETTLPRGKYFFGICTNSVDAQIGVNPYAGAISATAAFPLPSTAAAPGPTAVAPAVTVYAKDLPVTQGLFSYAEGTVRVYGTDVTGGNQPWGLDTATFKFVKSVDNGATWQQMMNQPNNAALEGSTLQDMIVTGGKLYVFTNKCTLWVSSDLTAGATWTNISCPTTAGLRHPTALGRPYGIAAFSGYVFIGEYSAIGGEFAPDGPRVLRYEIATGAWSLSKEFPGARHIHSFYDAGVALWVSCGDSGYGADVGVHRLTPAQIGTGSGGSDVWTRWTSNAAPNTNHYPVDFVVIAPVFTYDGKSSQPGIYGTSDRPGKHLLYSKTAGVAGAFNIAAQLFQRPGGPAGETVRSMVLDTATGNIFYWTAETTEQALYVTPPPYVQSVKLRDFPPAPSLILTRAVKSGNYIMMFNQRFKVEKFIGQA